MPITGGIKFFESLKTLASDGNTSAASSGDPSANFALDRNEFTCWRSSGSDDTITETWEFTFATVTTFDRLFIISHNFKEFVIQYDSSGFVDFSNVIGIDGPLVGGISETLFSDDTAYYEFDAVTTTKIRITVTKTQVADEEKFLTTFIATIERGTFIGFPGITNVSKDRNIREKTTLNGRMFIQKSIEVKQFDISFKNYPADIPTDLNLLISMFDDDSPSLVWLCGGRRNSPFFKFTIAGFRLRDLIQMHISNPFKDSYKNNFYNGVVKMKARMKETI